MLKLTIAHGFHFGQIKLYLVQHPQHFTVADWNHIATSAVRGQGPALCGEKIIEHGMLRLQAHDRIPLRLGRIEAGLDSIQIQTCIPGAIFAVRYALLQFCGQCLDGIEVPFGREIAAKG